MIKIFRNTEVNTKEQLSLQESISFVNSVVENVVDEENYTPMFYVVSLISTFFNTYTDIELPSLEVLYDEIDDYDIFMDEILRDETFNTTSYSRLINSIDDQIEFKKQQLLHKSPINELISEVTNVMVTLNTKIESLDMKSLVEFSKKANQKGFIEDMLANILKPKDVKKPEDHKAKANTKKVVDKVVTLPTTPSVLSEV